MWLSVKSEANQKLNRIQSNRIVFLKCFEWYRSSSDLSMVLDSVEVLLIPDMNSYCGKTSTPPQIPMMAYFSVWMFALVMAQFRGNSARNECNRSVMFRKWLKIQAECDRVPLEVGKCECVEQVKTIRLPGALRQQAYCLWNYHKIVIFNTTNTFLLPVFFNYIGKCTRNVTRHLINNLRAKRMCVDSTNLVLHQTHSRSGDIAFYK